MIEEWVTHYPATLLAKLNPRRFQADAERLHQTDLAQQNAYWGGEPAAEKLTQYLKPAQFLPEIIADCKVSNFFLARP